MKTLPTLLACVASLSAFDLQAQGQQLDTRLLGQWPGFQRGGQFESISIQGDRAFVTDEFDNFHVFDLSTPTPSRSGGTIAPGVLGTSAPGDLVFTVSATLNTIDVSEPDKPRQVSTAAILANDGRSVAASGNLACVAAGRRGLQIYDVTTPAAPKLVGSWDTNTDTHDVEVEGDLAFVANEDGLQVVDFSDPTAPTPVASLATAGPATRVFLNGDQAWVVASPGIVAIDLSNPRDPQQLGTMLTGVPTVKIVFDGDIAWAANINGYLQAIDISDPASPQLISHTGLAPINDLALSGNELWVVNWNGLQRIDTSDPAFPLLARTGRSLDRFHVMPS